MRVWLLLLLALSHKESSVGSLNIWSKIRLLEAVDDIPPGTAGYVEEILSDSRIRVRLISVIKTEIVCKMSQVEDITPLNEPGVSLDNSQLLVPPNSPRSPTLTHGSFGPWQYWSHVKASNWYNNMSCDGPLRCTGNRHACDGAREAFYDEISPNLNQKPITELFSNISPSQYQVTQAKMMDYITPLLQSWSQRLYCISVTYDHVFLLEQYDNMFRIYQSYVHSFDLKFWTNPSIHISQICEPGDSASNLQDSLRRSQAMSLGLIDDRVKIDQARLKYGCLQSISMDDILDLFRTLSKGFEIDAKRLTEGNDAILPASQALGDRNTNVWFGKSAIRISEMIVGEEPLEIEISFIEFVS